MPVNRPKALTRYVYGVYGLSEWQALIPVGRAKLRINFSGGETGGYGLVPATFVTTDRSVAMMIEKSEYFKTGRIRRLPPSQSPLP